MESSQKFASTGLAVSMVLLSFIPLASAGPKEDVETATLASGRALGEDDPDKVLPHYARRAILARAVIRAVARAMDVAGGAEFYGDFGAERRFRDVQAARFHPPQEMAQLQYAGLKALGLDING